MTLSVAPTSTVEGGSALTYTATLSGGVANNDITVTLGQRRGDHDRGGFELRDDDDSHPGDDVYIDGETITNSIVSAVEANAGSPGSLESLQLAADTSVSTAIEDTLDPVTVDLSVSPTLDG